MYCTYVIRLDMLECLFHIKKLQNYAAVKKYLRFKLLIHVKASQTTFIQLKNFENFSLSRIIYFKRDEQPDSITFIYLAERFKAKIPFISENIIFFG